MSGKWISIGRRPCGPAFAMSVASWAMAMARTMDSPRPRWVVDAGAVKSLEGVEEAVDLFGRDHRPGVRNGDDGFVAVDPGGDLHPGSRARCGARRPISPTGPASAPNSEVPVDGGELPRARMPPAKPYHLLPSSIPGKAGQ
jgi:hypothetical protein